MGVIIVREMVGVSPHSWSDAARQAVALASRTVRNIRTVEVVQSTARVEGGEIVEYRVQLKLGFEYEEQDRPLVGAARIHLTVDGHRFSAGQPCGRGMRGDANIRTNAGGAVGRVDRGPRNRARAGRLALKPG